MTVNIKLPLLQKADKIQGKTLVFRNATNEDAQFILSLRTNDRKSRFLSATDVNVEKQRNWLIDYYNKNDQAYFIIENSFGLPIGTVRLYDAQRTSFCWGSWILNEDASQAAAIESALMVYSYALDCLGFDRAHFDVRKGNESVWRFHERFGAIRVKTTELDYIYSIDSSAINASRLKYKKYLPSNVTYIS